MIIKATSIDIIYNTKIKNIILCFTIEIYFGNQNFSLLPAIEHSFNLLVVPLEPSLISKFPNFMSNIELKFYSRVEEQQPNSAES
ncbi:hypothetical protein BpHYR1_033356 [Brachionus plicatilis]|uniref:Uncharacterized protein n=1 Tax=Brachionus plicatilis TaxID=10195 RepID=A0A3M7PGM2_BRAPC|nr:hypothetical protein BpHYR1_033356 [Brachionus plicatilis]